MIADVQARKIIASVFSYAARHVANPKTPTPQERMGKVMWFGSPNYTDPETEERFPTFVFAFASESEKERDEMAALLLKTAANHRFE